MALVAKKAGIPTTIMVSTTTTIKGYVARVVVLPSAPPLFVPIPEIKTIWGT